ncbi:MAG: VOC family protein [Clostridia bacterium]|nr:VOC family protein [Clostridia bacterium]
MDDQIQSNVFENTEIKFKIHHVGCAVKNISEALKYYVGILGFKVVEDAFEVPSQKVKVCFIDVGNGTLIELVEGISEDSPVKKILEQPGGGVYHACYEVEDLEKAVSYLCNNKFLKYRRSEIRNERYRALYMVTPDDQLLELIQKL